MLIENYFFQKYNMSVLATHKRAKIDRETCHMKIEKIRKNKVFLPLPSVTTHINS